jgi:outer membrane lipase/esterase
MWLGETFVHRFVPLSIAAGATALAGLAEPALAQQGTIFGAGGSFTQVTGPISVTQNGIDNVVGVVQTGPNATTTISQSGFFNRAAVVQVGPTNTSTITQDGLFSRAAVFQFGPANLSDLAQTGGPSLALVQQGAGTPVIDPNVLVTNFLFAPETIPAQLEVGQIAARTFTNTLLTRLDANRFERCPQQMVNPTYSADLPSRPVAAPPIGCPAFAVYVTGTYATGSRDDRIGATGYDYDLGGVTIGAEYRVSPSLIFGTAFNYSAVSADLNRGFGSIDLDSYQFGLYTSISYPNWFVDAVVSFGIDRYDVSRLGVTASPDGNNFTAAAKGGYLFDVGIVRLGPIAGLAYAKNWIDAFTEIGDPLLAQSVSQRDLSALTGSVGVQFRVPFGIGGIPVDPYLNVTAEREYLNGQRIVSTRFLFDPTFPILSPVLNPDERVYGKVAGGVRVDFTPYISALLAAEGTFGRPDGNDFALNGGVKVKF